MDKEMLEILKQLVDGQKDTNSRLDKIDNRLDTMDSRIDKIDNRLDTMDNRLDKIDNRLESMDKKLDAVYDQTANLTEFRTEINAKIDTIQNDLNTVEVVTSKNWNDIAKLKAVK